MRKVKTPAPRVVVSRCLGFDCCRYDGEPVKSPAVRTLTPLVEFLPVCPEMEIGLGVPRDLIRITARRGVTRLVQPATNRDLTEVMASFSERYLESVGPVDGFILKSRSPSCGIGDVKVFVSPASRREAAVPGTGLFAKIARSRFPDVAVINEQDLENPPQRKLFLARVVAHARSRSVEPRVTRRKNRKVPLPPGRRLRARRTRGSE